MTVGQRLRALDNRVLGNPKTVPPAKSKTYGQLMTLIGLGGAVITIAFVWANDSPAISASGGFIGLMIAGIIRWRH